MPFSLGSSLLLFALIYLKTLLWFLQQSKRKRIRKPSSKGRHHENNDLPHHREEEKENPFDIVIRTFFQANLIKHQNVNKPFVGALFNYFESNTLPQVHFPDEKVENHDLQNNLQDNVLYNLQLGRNHLAISSYKTNVNPSKSLKQEVPISPNFQNKIIF